MSLCAHSVEFSVLIKPCWLQRRFGGAESRSSVMDGWVVVVGGKGAGGSQRDRLSALRGISMLSCLLRLSGAPRGLLMPLSAMQY